jgi:hypothetical protein
VKRPPAATRDVATTAVSRQHASTTPHTPAAIARDVSDDFYVDETLKLKRKRRMKGAPVQREHAEELSVIDVATVTDDQNQSWRVVVARALEHALAARQTLQDMPGPHAGLVDADLNVAIRLLALLLDSERRDR